MEACGGLNYWAKFIEGIKFDPEKTHNKLPPHQLLLCIFCTQEK